VEHVSLFAVLALLANLLIGVGLSVRVIMSRRSVGVSLAWITLVLIFPFVGAFIYLLLGELRLGNRRARWAAEIHDRYAAWLDELKQRCQVEWCEDDRECISLSLLTERSVGIPALPGNKLELFDEWQDVFTAIIADIDAAQRTCHLEFYIWYAGGMADDVCRALIRAEGRGVICRVLVDDVGSQAFLKTDMARQLRAGGVQLVAALPASVLRSLFFRFDLRMHRKIVVIDGRVAYTGSLNMADPRFFKKDAGVGQWIDAMVRVQGPAVEALAITFLEDWALESDDDISWLEETGDVHPLTPRGEAAVQVMPSGPAFRVEAMERVLLSTIYSARSELILTTPYFVPDEPLVVALISAAQRGVDVSLIVPAKVDSRLVRLASQAFQGDLVAAGVKVLFFSGGLLHTKSLSVDGKISLFGSLNFDPRSLHLNFEITLTVYNEEFTQHLRRVQQSYIARSQLRDVAFWQSRSTFRRFTENAARLAGPLL
jgi:cardiolipin synthase